MNERAKHRRPLGRLALAAALLVGGAWWVLGVRSSSGAGADPLALDPVPPFSREALRLEPGFPPAPWHADPVLLGSEVDDRRPVASSTGRDLRLLVLDVEGKPVPHLRLGVRTGLSDVIYDLERIPSSQALGRTDASGVLAFAAFEEEAVALVSLDPGWLVVGSSVLRGPWTGSFTVRVRRGGGVQGLVQGPDGPIAGATVGALVTTSWGGLGGGDAAEGLRPGVFDPGNVRWATTDHAGHFVIQGVLSSSSRLDVLAPGFAPLQHRFEGPRADEVVDVGALVVRRGVEATFHVSSSSPLGDEALLFLEASGNVFVRGNSGLALDENGDARVAGIEPGPYKWIVQRTGALAAKGTARVPETGGRVEVELPALRTLVVNVWTRAGAPVESFTARAKERGARAREFTGTGTVLVPCSAGAVVEVTIEAEGFTPSLKLRVPADEDAVDVELLRPGRLDLGLSGFGGLTAVHIGVVTGDQQDRLELVDQGISPVPLRVLALDAGRVMLDGLAPGTAWAILDIGAGPEALGPFVIEEAATTRADEALQPLRTIEGIVRDARTGAPCPGVAIRLCGSAGKGAALAALFASLARDEVPDATTREDGGFRASVRRDEDVVLAFERQGYESATVSIPARGPAEPIVVDLRPLPATTLEVLLTEGTPAARAVVEFTRYRGRTPEPLGQVRVDDEGRARLDRIPAGASEAVVRFVRGDGLRYRVALGEVEVEEEAPVRLVVAPDPGWIALGEGAPDDLSDVVLRRDSAPGVGWVEVRCDDVPAEGLTVPPGTYRVSGRTASGLRYAACEVRGGETALVAWKGAEGQLRIVLTGEDWTSCRVRLEARDGDLVGYTRDLLLERGADDATLGDLPRGSYHATLLDWTTRSGARVDADWSETVTVLDTPSTVTFDIAAAVRSGLRVVDENGRALAGVPVRVVALEGDVARVLSATTDRAGLARLVLPPGEVFALVSADGFAPVVRGLDPIADSVVEVACDAGGTLEVKLSGTPETGAPIVRLVPDPPSTSTLEAALLGAALDDLSAPLAHLHGGSSVVLEAIPEGTYLVIAIVEGRIVASEPVAIRAGRAAAVTLTPR